MKKKLTVNLLILCSLMMVVLLNNCDIKDPTKGIEVRVKNIARTTTVRVDFVDGNTSKLVGDGTGTKVNVVFEGASKNNIISDVNEPMTTAVSKNGVVYFAIKDDIVPSVNNPIDVVLVCTADNYLNTSVRLQLVTTGVHNQTVKMVNLTSGQQPDGVQSNTEQEGSTGSQGTNQDISVTSGTTNNGQSASIEVPSGTQLLDQNGNVLSGNVTTSVTYFDPTSESSLQSFPGGFQVNTNNEGNGNFVSAGFVAVNMNVNGTPVKNFQNGGANINISVPANLTNPNTGQQVKPGDVIPLWSYNETTGQWTHEGDYTVPLSKTNKGKYNISIRNIKHLSYWNLDWFTNSCYLGTKIHFTGNFNSLFIMLYKLTNGEPYYYSCHYVFNTDPYLQFMYTPQNTPMKIVAYKSYQDYCQRVTPVGSLTLNDLCDEVTVDLPITLPVEENAVDVYVRGICPNGNVLDQGTLNVEIFKDGQWQLAGTIVNGYIKLTLALNTPYKFRVFYDGKFYEQTHTATKTVEHVDITLGGDIDLCK
jgi:hypothetical protein